MELGDDGHLMNVFWIDARSRMAYAHFGDVVTFDTTYLTNKYTMKFAPFVGVNHHGQSTLLGCALLTYETKDSFMWVFKTWLAAMEGRAPKAIITDQDRSIKAVKQLYSRLQRCRSDTTSKLKTPTANMIPQAATVNQNPSIQGNMDYRMEDKLPEANEEDTEDLKLRVWGESKKFWTVAFPAIVSRVTSFGTIVVTQSFMGHIGATELASYALLQTFLVRFSNGILAGMASALETLCGQAYGAKQYHMLGIYMQRSWIVVLATATLMVPLLVFATPFFRLVGQEEELSLKAGEIAVWFIPMLYYFVFNFTLQMYLQSQRRNGIIAWLSALSFVGHLILSWLFVYKLNMGIPGAMISLIISSWFVVIGQLIYVVGGWCPDTWKGFSKRGYSELWPVVKLSASFGVMLCLELWYNAVLVLIAGHMDNAKVSIGAFSICLNIVSWQLMIFFGFLTASSVRVSNELGRGDAKAAKFSVKVIMSTSLLLGVIFTVLSLAFRNVISYAFTDSTEVAQAVSKLSILLAISVFLGSIQPVLTGVAIGSGWQATIANVNLASYYAIGLPIGVLFAYVAHLEVNGIWIGMSTGVGIQTVVLIFMTWRTDWDSQVEKASVRLNRLYIPTSQGLDENTNQA